MRKLLPLLICLSLSIFTVARAAKPAQVFASEQDANASPSDTGTEQEEPSHDDDSATGASNDEGEDANDDYGDDAAADQGTATDQGNAADQGTATDQGNAADQGTATDQGTAADDDEDDDGDDDGGSGG